MKDDVFDVVEGGVVLRVHVQPGSARAAMIGRHGDSVKVKVAAPPLEGRANAAVVALLASTFGVKPTAVTLLSGETSRAKRFRIDGLDVATTRAAIDAALAETGGPKPRRSR